MKLRFSLVLSVFELALVSSGAAFGTFTLLEVCAQENEHAGMLYSGFSNGLCQKMPHGNAMFSQLEITPARRRAVFMLTREPKNVREYTEASNRMESLCVNLPEGNRLFLIDDSGEILLDRIIPPTRKVFDLVGEIQILCARLNSAPVFYFPSDSVRPLVQEEEWEALSPRQTHKGTDAL